MYTQVQKKLFLLIMMLLAVSSIMFSQHRGDLLGYQGIDNFSGNSVRAQGMGNAFTGVSGDINALFFNPAGLIGLEGMQFSVAANNYENNWWENQEYEPNRQFVTLSFILEGLYVPDPANNGILDHDVFLSDTNYVVQDPLVGVDEYSEKAADWKKKKSAFAFNNLIGAIPFQLGDQKFVVAGGYNVRNVLNDYDRNDTYLAPHPSSHLYNPIPGLVRGPTDSVRVNWYRYERNRDGIIHNFKGAIAYELNDMLTFGIGGDFFSGTSDDDLSLRKVGFIDLLYEANNYRFTYDTSGTVIQGTSEFLGYSFNLSGMLKLDRFSLGLRIDLPYTMERLSDYTTTRYTVNAEIKSQRKSKDYLDIPMGYAVGLSFTPAPGFRFALDYMRKNYASADFMYGLPDSTHRSWVDRKTISFGMEYQPWEMVGFRAGYSFQTQSFVPDGAALQDEGPAATSYTFGTSVFAFSGRFDIAYEYRYLKYSDIFYSNSNYNFKSLSNFLISYTFFM